MLARSEHGRVSFTTTAVGTPWKRRHALVSFADPQQIVIENAYRNGEAAHRETADEAF